MIRRSSFRNNPAFGIAIAALIALAAPAHARLTREQVKLPVKVTDGYGRQIEHDIVVTIFRDDATPLPRPALVLNHGRSASAQGRAALGRAQFTVASTWLTSLGFIVAVPTRVGYGVTGGEDVEDTGSCNRKNYPPGYAASAAQTLEVLEMLRRRPDVARDRAVIMGQSFGGTTAITVAALNPPGIQATINFAGGGGGNPVDRPQNPCGISKLEDLFAGYGRSARIPTLWVYSENDMYFGAKLPKEWFDAFKAAGGTGEFVVYPPHGEDGHGLFTRAPEVWKPRVMEFLRANGFPELR